MNDAQEVYGVVNADNTTYMNYDGISAHTWDRGQLNKQGGMIEGVKRIFTGGITGPVGDVSNSRDVDTYNDFLSEFDEIYYPNGTVRPDSGAEAWSSL